MPEPGSIQRHLIVFILYKDKDIGDNAVTSLIRIAQAFPMLVAYMYTEVLYGNVKIYG